MASFDMKSIYSASIDAVILVERYHSLTIYIDISAAIEQLYMTRLAGFRLHFIDNRSAPMSILYFTLINIADGGGYLLLPRHVLPYRASSAHRHFISSQPVAHLLASARARHVSMIRRYFGGSIFLRFIS